MTQTDFIITRDIPAPLPLVWSVLADVERWPEWTASIARVKMLSPGPLQVGSRVRIHQPQLPPAWWQVTELNPGASFTWISRAPGVLVTAQHAAEETAASTRPVRERAAPLIVNSRPRSHRASVTLSIRYEGLVGKLLARWVGKLNERYLEMEVNGLKARCAGLSANLVSEHHEAH